MFRLPHRSLARQLLHLPSPQCFFSSSSTNIHRFARSFSATQLPGDRGSGNSNRGEHTNFVLGVAVVSAILSGIYSNFSFNWKVQNSLQNVTNFWNQDTEAKKFENQMNELKAKESRESPINIAVSKIRQPWKPPNEPKLYISRPVLEKELQEELSSQQLLTVVVGEAYGRAGQSQVVRQICKGKEVLFFQLQVGWRSELTSDLPCTLLQKVAWSVDNEPSADLKTLQEILQRATSETKPIVLIEVDVSRYYSEGLYHLFSTAMSLAKFSQRVYIVIEDPDAIALVDDARIKTVCVSGFTKEEAKLFLTNRLEQVNCLDKIPIQKFDEIFEKIGTRASTLIDLVKADDPEKFIQATQKIGRDQVEDALRKYVKFATVFAALLEQESLPEQTVLTMMGYKQLIDLLPAVRETAVLSYNAGKHSFSFRTTAVRNAAKEWKK